MSARADRARREAAFLRQIRYFFDQCGFCEVRTPVRVRTPALEDTIDAIPAGNMWLRTSPELHMKRLICDGLTQIYQLGPCFRAAEFGRLHRNEFTMLEFYEAPGDYQTILERTQQLLATLLPERWAGPWERLTVDEAFRRYANVSAQDALERGEFDFLLVDRIERNLGHQQPTVLIDYPAPLAALARRSPANPAVAERWELYIDGIEIANAYSELTDAAEQRQRFEECAVYRQQDGRDQYALDEAFLAALEEGMPPCGGVAVGIDRLLMRYADQKRLSDVLLFPDEESP